VKTEVTMPPTGDDPARRPGALALVLAVTVIAIVAVVVLGLTGHAAEAVVVSTVWAATCGLLMPKRA